MGRLEADTDDAEGQMSAVMRQTLNETAKVPAPSTPSEGSVMYGNADKKSYENNGKNTVYGVRNIGNQAIYQRGKVWIAANASDVDLEDSSKIINVDRFSEDYFNLTRQNTVEENRILSTQGDGEELVISLRGQVYRIR